MHIGFSVALEDPGVHRRAQAAVGVQVLQALRRPVRLDIGRRGAEGAGARHQPSGDEPGIPQLTETDRAKREATLHQIQRLLHERTRFAPIFDYVWPSGVGPRVEEPGLMLINPYPWAAPLEEVRLKRP